MELDFKTIKALSSPTRIEILTSVLNDRKTTTDLSNDLDKSKSTISSHLSTLESADLVEKDSKEGRRRVMYSSTPKAQSIVSGKEKRVKFSLASSAVSAVGGIALAGFGAFQMFGVSSAQSASVESQDSGAMSTMAMDQAGRTASETSGFAFENLISPELFLFAGAGFLAISGSLFLFGVVNRKLGEE